MAADKAGALVSLIMAKRPSADAGPDRRRKLAAEWLDAVDAALKDRSDDAVDRVLDGFEALSGGDSSGEG